MIRRRERYAETLVVQCPRGYMAILWLDPTDEWVMTNHAGMRAIIQRGVRDWEGHLLFPRDGRAFLSAVYDHLFLSGYRIRWMKSKGGMGLRKGRRD